MPRPEMDSKYLRAMSARLFGPLNHEEVPRANGKHPAFAAPYHGAVETDFRTLERRAIHQTQWRVVWPTCPNCHQSATSVYEDRPACTRCGWMDGSSHFRRSAL